MYVNIAITKKVVEVAKVSNVSVEAELGTIGTTGDSYEGLTVAFDLMEGEFSEEDQAFLTAVLLEKDEIASATFKKDEGEYLELIFAQKELV